MARKALLLLGVLLGMMLAIVGYFACRRFANPEPAPPWFGALVSATYDGASPVAGLICGAVLLNENWAITDAHCVRERRSSELELVFNVADICGLFGHEARSDVAGIFVHPESNPVTLQYDVALLRLDQPVSSWNTPSVGSSSVDDEKLTILGWGSSIGGSRTCRTTHETMLNIEASRCHSILPSGASGRFDGESMGCALGLVDTCAGDSGGASSNQSGELVGLVSWGVGCNRDTSPTVFARLDVALEWIRTMANNE